jgi:general secretion pathway protein K
MSLHKQKGVAIVTALLLTTLAITIVASLFWQQQVQVRSIENQRYQLQKKWVLRGALDWATLILREDFRTSPNVDHLGEPWAVNLGETKLDQYVENGRADTEASDASLSGQISDAQAKFNLSNLSNMGKVRPLDVKVFERLLTNLRMDPGLARQVALSISATQELEVKSASSPETGNPDGGVGGGQESDGDISFPVRTDAEVKFMRFSQVDDLLSQPSFTPEMVQRLRNYVTVLPRATAVNINTTSAEVLSAVLEKVSMSEASIMIAARDRAYFRDLNDFNTQFPDKASGAAVNAVAFKSDFFVINGKVKLSRSGLEIDALLERNQKKTKIWWVRER